MDLGARAGTACWLPSFLGAALAIRTLCTNLCAELTCGCRSVREGPWCRPDAGLRPDTPDLSCHTRKGHGRPCLAYLSAVRWGLGDCQGG